MYIKCSIIAMLIIASQAVADCEGSGCQCSASSSGVNFGVYNSISNIAKDITGTASITCSGKSNARVNYEIKLSTGSSGTFSTRSMRKGNTSLFYNLFLNANRTQIWGDGSNNTGIKSDSLRLNHSTVTKNYTIYARMPGGQNVTAGIYQDTIIMTVIY